ncbi:hypothetical protein [Nonomuraea rubra]|uniref:hypothetical protein n=1 Tax=Nonomuraea rubra TaxID=46180 RepID=UPI0031E8DF5F
MMRPIAAVVAVVALAVSGCAIAGFDEANRVPQNDGANANVGDSLSLRNIFLLGGTDSASPPAQQALFGVIVNDAQRPDQLERSPWRGRRHRAARRAAPPRCDQCRLHRHHQSHRLGAQRNVNVIGTTLPRTARWAVPIGVVARAVGRPGVVGGSA